MTSKVLMVCLGNICRSPLAEGVLRHLTIGSDFFIDSAGTANYHTGAPPDKRSIAVAAANGIDISAQKARQLSKADLDYFDHILVMDEQNLSDVLDLCANAEQKQKVALLTKAGGLDAEKVPDPYYGNEKDFKFVYTLVFNSCKAWLAKQY